MIKFSIITITYNAGDVVGRTLNSVLNQTYADIEHIIIDGASQDYTLDKENKYKEQSDEAANGHDIRIISEPDDGLYDAMNKGLRLATGDYLCFMNAGDAFATHATIEQIACKVDEYARQNSGDGLPAVLYGDTYWTDNEGNVICRRPLSPPEKLTWRSFRRGMLVCHQAFYARVDVARSIKYNLRYRHSADVDWCIRVMKEAEKKNLTLLNLHAIVALYQREGQTTEFHRASLLERFDIMRRHYGLLVTVAMHLWFVIRTLRRKLG